MKLTSLLLVCSGILSFNLQSSSPVLAQCVQTDVGVQVDVSRGEAKQTYNRDAQIEGACSGNTNVSTGVQVNVSGDGVEQNRRVRQRMSNPNNNRGRVNGPVFQHGVNVQFDLDNKADGYEPNLPSNRSRR